MKKVYVMALAMAICSTTFAQNFLGMPLKKFGISTTTDQDRVNGLDAEYFTKLSRSGVSEDIANQNFPEEAITSMTCENPSIRIELTVLPFRASPNLHLNLGTSVMFNRIDATGYSFQEYGSLQNNMNDIKFNSISDEAALDASLLYNKKFAFVNLYGGVGTNLGYTFNGDMQIEGQYLNSETEAADGRDGGSVSTSEYVYFSEYHRMKNSLHQRAFLQAGVSVVFFKRLELGIEGRRGIGYRYNAGNAMKFTNLLSAGFTAKWNLK